MPLISLEVLEPVESIVQPTEECPLPKRNRVTGRGLTAMTDLALLKIDSCYPCDPKISARIVQTNPLRETGRTQRAHSDAGDLITV
jgi:hypothetical protein